MGYTPYCETLSMSRIFAKFRAISRNFVQFRAISRNFMQLFLWLDIATFVAGTNQFHRFQTDSV